MEITATELKENLGKYLSLASSRDIRVTQYGKPAATLTSPFKDRLAVLRRLEGCVPADVTLEEALDERAAAQ